MSSFVKEIKDSAEKFTIFDIGVLKICVYAFGILSGVYFYRFFSSVTKWIWAVYVSTFIYIIYRTFQKVCFRKKQ